MEQKIKDAKQWYDNNKALYEQFSMELEGIITNILNDKKIPYQSISHRVKERDSYLNKCADEKYKTPIKQITDVSGIRVIAYTNHDVSSICKVLQEEFLIDEDNSGNKADMLDCEFERLSKEIDEYTKHMEKDVLKGNYNTIGIDSKSVEQYVLEKFQGVSNIIACNGKIVSEEVVEELVRFGYQAIQEIEDDFNYYGDIWQYERGTYIGVLRDLMIIKDCEKYFNMHTGTVGNGSQ